MMNVNPIFKGCNAGEIDANISDEPNIVIECKPTKHFIILCYSDE